MEFILSSDLAICNRGNEPTFVIGNRQEVLDITLDASQLIQKISDWKILDEKRFSDNRYIDFNLVEQDENPSIPPNIRKANWSQYVKTFNRLIPKTPETNVETVTDVEETVETVAAIILSER